jgi:hypothetical protein
VSTGVTETMESVVGTTRYKRLLIVAGCLVGLGAASCGGTSARSSHVDATKATTTARPPTTATSVVPPAPTTVANNVYSSDYATIYELVRDSTFIVLGTLDPEISGSGQTGYPIEVQQTFGINNPRTSIGVSVAEFNAAKLSVGGTYVFFWGIDSAERVACIVGGVRGVMAYDPSSDTVTRLDTSATSHIPRVQTLEQLTSSVSAAVNEVVAEPATNPRPVCSPSATGLSQ